MQVEMIAQLEAGKSYAVRLREWPQTQDAIRELQAQMDKAHLATGCNFIVIGPHMEWLGAWDSGGGFVELVCKIVARKLTFSA